jgi:hypothetical protein
MAENNIIIEGKPKTPKWTFEKHPEIASKAGKKSKRKPLDVVWRKKLEEYTIANSEDQQLLIDELFQILIKTARSGGSESLKAIDQLLDRAYGKAKSSLTITDESVLSEAPKSLKIEFVTKEVPQITEIKESDE